MATRECYLAMLEMDEQMQMMIIEERRTVAELAEVLEMFHWMSLTRRGLQELRQAWKKRRSKTSSNSSKGAQMFLLGATKKYL